MSEEPEVDVQRLIKELAATGIDPWYVWEAVTIEQEEAAARSKQTAQTPRPRPQLRVVVAGRE